MSGQNFFDKKMKNSKATELTYTMRLKTYCDNIGKNPDQLIALKLEGLQNVNTEKEFQAENLLENFLRQDKYLSKDENGKTKEREFTESSKIAMLAAIKSFYASTRGRDLTKDTGEFLETPEAKKRTPTLEDCLKLEEAMMTDRDKFLVWFLQSIQVRKGTLRQLKFGDLKPLNDKDVPFWLQVGAKRLKGGGKGKYRKAKHIGFLHYYAAQNFEAYKEELKQKSIPFNDNTPLFVSYKSTAQGKKGEGLTNIYALFVDASEKAFKGEKRFSAHDFRDIIPTILKNKLKISGNLVKALSSHVPQGIEAIYESTNDSEDKPDEDLLKVFKQCLPYLVPETVAELKVELNEQKTENQKQQSQLEAQNSKIVEQQQKIDLIMAFMEQFKQEQQERFKRIDEAKAEFEESNAKLLEQTKKLKQLSKEAQKLNK